MTDRIENSIELKVPIERVWRALTDHHEFGTWFRAVLDGPFVVGERSTGRITYPGYEHYRWDATVVQMDEPRHFAFTWPHPVVPAESDSERAGAPSTLVAFDLDPTPEGTRLTVVESGFEALPPDRREEAIRNNERGWAEQMKNIEAHLRG